jgi:hypothetical protein
LAAVVVGSVASFLPAVGSAEPPPAPSDGETFRIVPGPEMVDAAWTVLIDLQKQQIPDEMSAVSLHGGLPVLHVMVYRDWSVRDLAVEAERIAGAKRAAELNRIDQAARAGDRSRTLPADQPDVGADGRSEPPAAAPAGPYREIRSYDLVLHGPSYAVDETKPRVVVRDGPDAGKSSLGVYQPLHRYLFEVYDQGLIVRGMGIRASSQRPGDTGSAIYSRLGYAYALPDAPPNAYARVPPDRIRDGVLKAVPFAPPPERLPAFPPPRVDFETPSEPFKVVAKELRALVRYTYRAQVYVGVEFLPIPNPATTDTLRTLAERYRADAERDPLDAAARYYWAWTARFLAARFAGEKNEPLRERYDAEAERAIAEACRLEPDQPAFTAMRRDLLCGRIQRTKAGDRAGILWAVDEVFTLQPTDEDCHNAAYGFRTFAVGDDMELAAAVTRLARRSLAWNAEWPMELKRNLEHWTATNARPGYRLPAVDELISEYRKRLPVERGR